MKQTHILIVEDDPFTSKMLAFLLADSGYETTILADPRAVRPFLQAHSVALVLLDVLLPYIDGLTLCAAIRNEHPDIPVIFLSVRCTPRDKVEGFNHGADDYLGKPFEPMELIARMQSVLRRYHRTDHETMRMVIKVGVTSLDIGRLQFDAPPRLPVLLTPTEAKILEYLMRHANVVISREALIERIGGCTSSGTGNRVDVYIRRLRRKIETNSDEPVFIHTVRGVGYLFRDGKRDAPAATG